MMQRDIVEAKLPFLGDIAYFATDVSHKFLSEAGYPRADALFDASRALIGAAGYSADPAEMLRAFHALPPKHKDALTAFLGETSLLSRPEVPADPVADLDSAMNMHWVRQFDLGPVGDSAAARAALGDDNAAALESFIDGQVDLFWKHDALAEKLNAEPLSPDDMRIAAAYRLTMDDGSVLSDVTAFLNTETLRERLRKGELRLSSGAAATLQNGLNRTLHRIRPDRPPVSITGWLT